MLSPSLPADEPQRQQALLACGLLDSGPEERFDRLTRLARQLFQVPIALVSLVDANRQWFKSRQGLDVTETARDISFCGHTILADDALCVNDAAQDDRFADNPLVTGPPHIRFYAGIPLSSLDGHRIGSLCIIDSKPRHLSADQLKALRDLADCVEKEIGARQHEEQHQALLTLAEIGSLVVSDPKSHLRQALQLACHYLSLPYGLIGRTINGYTQIHVQVSPSGSLRDGQHLVHTGSYFEQTLEAGDVVVVRTTERKPDDGKTPGLDLSLYIGVPLKMDGVVYGTLSFGDRGGASGRPLVEADIEFVRLLGAWVAATECRIHLDRSLRKHRDLERAIAQAQARSIAGSNRNQEFDSLLVDAMHFSESAFGFIAETVRDEDGHTALRTFAIDQLDWDETTRAEHRQRLAKGDEPDLSNPIFLQVALKGLPVVLGELDSDDAVSSPWLPPSIQNFLGLPVYYGEQRVAVLGLANRSAGYDAELIELLTPLVLSLGQLVEASRSRTRLLQSEQRMRSIIEGTRIGTWEWNIETDQIVINSLWAEIIGCTVDQLRPFTMTQWQALIHPDDVPLRAELLASHVQGTPKLLDVRYRIRHRDGRWVWVQDRARVVHHSRDGHPLLMTGTHADITVQTLAEAELNRVAGLLGNVLDAASEVSIIATATDGLITIFNRGAERLLGYQAVEVVGKQQPTIFHLGTEICAREASLSKEFGHPVSGFRVLVEKPERDGAETQEWTFVRRDGKQVLVSVVVTPMRDPGGSIAGYLSIAQDITSRRLAEAALNDQAEHTQTILDNIVDGIITINERGIIDSFNPAAERIFGYRAGDVLGKNVKMLMPGEHSRQHDTYLSNYHRTGIARIMGIGREVEGLRKDLTLFAMELSVSEITRQGRPMYVGMVRDISERKRIDRMKSEFVSTVSHELRTPLTAIAGALRLVESGTLGALADPVENLIKVASKNSQRLTFLINDLLDMEKLVAGKMHFDMVRQPLSPLLIQAIETNRGYGTERGVTLQLDTDDGDHEVCVDSRRLAQVLSNLLSNAIKYSPDGASVKIECKPMDRSVRVAITDQGPGIPAHFQALVFQKFAQADSSDTRQKGGTGLGLAITRELVERMGGHIGFVSREGHGASFFFDLPLAELPDAASSHVGTAEPSPV